MTIGIVAFYLILVLAVGSLSLRSFRGTDEDYFVATRTIGPVLLLASLFGTHMTAFSILGASGEAYHRGIGVFALMASSSALVVPAVFLFIGVKAWRLGRRNGYLTQVELVRDRWGSRPLSLALFAVLALLLTPYLMIGVKGGGLTLAAITDGSIPEWAGSVIICLVVLTYVTLGGLRGTAWVNALQTGILISFALFLLVNVIQGAGGLQRAMAEVALESPALLIRGEAIRPLEMLSFMAIPLSAGMFPHLFMHWLTARRASSFKLPIVAYPICVAAVWLPSVLVGVIGTIGFPDLVGPQSNSLLVRAVAASAHPALAGLLAVGVLAAIMSSLDSQVLSLGTLFSRESGGATGASEVSGAGSAQDSQGRQERAVARGRAFVIVVIAVVLILSLLADRSLFKLGIWSFSGFSALFPIIVAALYWRRATLAGAWASLIAAVVTWIGFFIRAWNQPGYTVGDSGLMPVVVMLAASTAAMIVVSLLTAAPDQRRLDRFFPPLRLLRTESIESAESTESATDRR